MKTDFTNKSKGIKAWAVEDRPREKLMLKGKNALTNAELLAILIGSGNAHQSAVDLCKAILQEADNKLINIGRLNINELTKFKGIGQAKAISIVAAMELGNRLQLAKIDPAKPIASSYAAANLFIPILRDKVNEEFWVAYLDRKLQVISKKIISAGGISGTVVDIRIIFKKAVELLASNIILCHNHPSGNLKASQADKDITQKIVKAGKVLDVRIIDHIIVGHNNYFSFADNGLI